MPRRSRPTCSPPRSPASRARRGCRSIVVKAGDRISLGPFEVEYINVAHSIPESHALAIRTPLGTRASTAATGSSTTSRRSGCRPTRRGFRRIGEEGVLALICDSTNAMREGAQPERDRGRARTRRDHPHRQGTAGRLHDLRLECRAPAVDRACRRGSRARRGRGRPRHAPGHRCGRPNSACSTTRRRSSTRTRYAYLPRDKVVVLLTGSQGEPRAALARVAFDDHPRIELAAGRHRRLLGARHPRQRIRHQPHHQRADRARHPRRSPTATGWCTSPAIRAATKCARCTAG